MAGGAGGSGGMGQQPMGNASAQPGGGAPSFAQPYMSGLGQPAGNASAQPYNPMGDTFKSQATPGNFGQGLNAMSGILGQPAGNASAQQTQSPLQAPQQPFGMQPMQSPFQAPQQPSPMGGMRAEPAVLNPSEFTRYLGGQQRDSQMGMQNQMPPGMQNQTQSQMQMQMEEMAKRAMPGMRPGDRVGAMSTPGQNPFGSGMPPDMQPGMQPGGQQVDQYTRQLGGLLPPTQVGQPLPPGFGRQLGGQGQQTPFGYDGSGLPQMPPGYGGSGLPPMQTPFQMPDGGGQLGPSPYPNPSSGLGQVSRPDLLKLMGQSPSGGIGSLPSAMSQPQSKQQMKEQMRQQDRMGPMPRTRPGGQPQQMFNEPQQYMY